MAEYASRECERRRRRWRGGIARLLLLPVLRRRWLRAPVLVSRRRGAAGTLVEPVSPTATGAILLAVGTARRLRLLGLIRKRRLLLHRLLWRALVLLLLRWRRRPQRLLLVVVVAPESTAATVVPSGRARKSCQAAGTCWTARVFACGNKRGLRLLRMVSVTAAAAGAVLRVVLTRRRRRGRSIPRIATAVAAVGLATSSAAAPAAIAVIAVIAEWRLMKVVFTVVGRSSRRVPVSKIGRSISCCGLGEE